MRCTDDTRGGKGGGALLKWCCTILLNCILETFNFENVYFWGHCAAQRALAQCGTDTYYNSHDGIHLLQLVWSHALPDPQLKVQHQARLARSHTIWLWGACFDDMSAATPLLCPSCWVESRNPRPCGLRAHGGFPLLYLRHRLPFTLRGRGLLRLSAPSALCNAQLDSSTCWMHVCNITQLSARPFCKSRTKIDWFSAVQAAVSGHVLMVGGCWIRTCWRLWSILLKHGHFKIILIYDTDLWPQTPSPPQGAVKWTER